MKQKTSLSAIEFLLVLVVLSIAAGLAIPYYQLEAAERAYMEGL